MVIIKEVNDKTNVNKLSYYIGFNDGVFSCFRFLEELANSVENLKKAKHIKHAVYYTLTAIAEIVNTTSKNIERYIKEEKENGLE